MSVTLLSAGSLPALLESPERPVILDARREGEYLSGHIPGAIWIPWEDWCEPPPPEASDALRQRGYWGKLAPDDEAWFGSRLGALGIDSARSIVVYANGPASRGRDARIAWMLLYLGALEVALLDGGWPHWLAVEGRVETEAGTHPPARFEVSFQPERRAQLSDLVTPDGAPRLVDTRSQREFTGTDYDYMPRRGRIPGALHIPFTDLFESDGRFLSKKHYPERLGRGLDRERAVTYCEVGVRACTFALLHEVYTGRAVGVYDGSFMEWALHPELPVEAG